MMKILLIVYSLPLILLSLAIFGLIFKPEVMEPRWSIYLLIALSSLAVYFSQTYATRWFKKYIEDEKFLLFFRVFFSIASIIGGFVIVYFFM